ncbi:hypothetical protein FA13DRAFT_1632596 [Coprinellus micaceus]|uniref:Acyltransferase 3 domain-containing protein n=1 Tax=Coprinellus micaceus TaxID=71717 RepID=A0A4Y7T4H7_COPMI|nr:hypothetical protein FA13DRAFT_1632596 [Coprinellus micaceus]
MLSLDIEQSEESGWADDDRIHHIDNLRATLTLILVVQHTLIENASATPGFQSLPLTAFVFQCKTTLPSLFFFVSGYAASISRENVSLQPGTGRSDAEFLWRRTKRLFLPAVAYGAYGQAALWSILTKGWPLVFGGVGSTSDQGFAKLQGPVVYLVFLYAMDVAYVATQPSRQKATFTRLASSTTAPPPDHPRTHRSFPFVVRSTRDWYALSTTVLCAVALYTVAAACGGKSDHSFLRLAFELSTYDTIIPAAPFQFILAYMAGTQLYRWQRYMLIPTPFAFPAFAFALFSSSSFLLVAAMISPPFAEIIEIASSSPLHRSFINAGVNFHTILFALWNVYAFFTTSATLVSIYAQWEWTRRDWGIISRTSYVPAWFHMIPVVVFTRLLGADVGARVVPGTPLTAPPSDASQQSLEWRCLLVATGSIICSWFVGLSLAGLGEVLRC